jgi:hypothetical protein
MGSPVLEVVFCARNATSPASRTCEPHSCGHTFQAEAPNSLRIARVAASNHGLSRETKIWLVPSGSGKDIGSINGTRSIPVA